MVKVPYVKNRRRCRLTSSELGLLRSYLRDEYYCHLLRRLSISAICAGTFGRAGFHPGFVTISSLAALELLENAGGVVLAARLSGRVLTVSLLREGVLRLARCVELNGPDFEEAAAVIFPTMAFAEDELGEPISTVWHCGFDEFGRGWQEAFTVPLQPFQSAWKAPAGQDAGMLGYLKATASA